MKKKRTLTLAAAVLAGLMLTSTVSAALAATTKTQFFTEECTEAELDTLLWETSVSDTEHVTVKEVGEPAYSVLPGNYGYTMIQGTEPITLAEGESFTVETKVGNIPATARFWTQYLPSDEIPPADQNAIQQDALLVMLGTGIMFGFITGEKTNMKQFLNYQANADCAVTGPGEGFQATFGAWGRGENGVTAEDKSAFNIKATYNYDGSGEVAIADFGKDNYFPIIKFYANTDETRGGLRSIDEGYFRIAFDQTSVPIKYYNQKLTKYSAENEPTVVYDEHFTDAENAKVKALEPWGGGIFGVTQNGITVDNAAADDYVVKKSAIKAPASLLNDELYNIKFGLYLGEMTGTATANLFFTADKTDLSEAAKITFGLKEDALTVTVGGTEAVLGKKIGDFFDLTVSGGKDNVNKVYAGDNLIGSFEAELAGKFFGINTEGTDTENKASISLTGVKGLSFSYSQGNGDDITEDFADGLYNGGNFSFIRSGIDEAESISITEKGLKFDRTPRDAVFATNYKYGDFEFTLELSEIGVGGFGVFWCGTDGFSGPTGGAVYTQWGNDWYSLYENTTFKSGYGRYNDSPIYPTDVEPTEEEANPGRFFTNYNFSQGNLVMKFVKVADEIEIWVYPKDAAEDNITKTRPFTVIEGYYGEAGTIGILSMSNDVGINMTIASVSIKNLDENKATTLYKGSDDERKEFDLYYEEPEPTPEKPGGCKGCKSSAGGIGALTALAGIAAAGFAVKKKRK